MDWCYSDGVQGSVALGSRDSPVLTHTGPLWCHVVETVVGVAVGLGRPRALLPVAGGGCYL